MSDSASLQGEVAMKLKETEAALAKANKDLVDAKKSLEGQMAVIDSFHRFIQRRRHPSLFRVCFQMF